MFFSVFSERLGPAITVLFQTVGEKKINKQEGHNSSGTMFFGNYGNTPKKISFFFFAFLHTTTEKCSYRKDHGCETDH